MTTAKKAPAEAAIEKVAERVAEIQTDTPMSVHQAIAVVMRRMPAIGKDSAAPPNMGGYKFRGIEAITSTLQPILGSVGLVIVPQAVSIVIDPAPGQKEAWQDILVKFDWLVIGPDGSTVQASTYGIGRDHTDKGANKAQTQAYKYLLMHLFCISDSKDDVDGFDYSDTGRDIHDDVPREKTVDEAETDALVEQMKALPDDQKEALKTWAHSLERTLAPSVLVADAEWRSEIRTLIAEMADDDTESEL